MSKKRPFYITARVAGFMMMLSACAPPPLTNTISYIVWNNVPAAENMCLGGLKGRLSSREAILFESPVVSFGETFQEDKMREGIGQGDNVNAEAWCYDAEGNETNYISASGKFIADYSVTVSFNEPATSPQCLKANESRGTPPCISSRIIQQ